MKATTTHVEVSHQWPGRFFTQLSTFRGEGAVADVQAQQARPLAAEQLIHDCPSESCRSQSEFLKQRPLCTSQGADACIADYVVGKVEHLQIWPAGLAEVAYSFITQEIAAEVKLL